MRLRQEPPRPEPAPRLALSAPEATAALPVGDTVRFRHIPTFERAGKTLWRRVRRPRLTRRRAAITLAVTSLLGVRWIDANQEPVWPTFAPSYPAATAGPNAAHFYHAAVEAYVGDGPGYAAAQRALPADLPRWTSLDDPVAPMALKRAAATDNAAALRWLHEASGHAYAGNFDGRWLKAHVPTTPSLSDPMPNFILIRELARAAAGSCDVLAADGRADLAVDRALDVAQWGVNLTHDPTLIEGMIGCLIQGIGWTKAAAHADALTPEQARAALERLERLPAPARFDEIVRHEAAVGAGGFRELFQASDANVLTGGSGSLASRITGRVAQDAMVLFYTKRGLVQNYTDLMDQQARLAELPYQTSVPASQALQTRIDRGTGLNWFTRIVAPNLQKARMSYERQIAYRQVLRTRLALKVWRGMHRGALPSGLDALVDAGLLASAPTDPFSQDAAQPLRYDPATGKVWSVGANGIDEGGKGDDGLDRW